MTTWAARRVKDRIVCGRRVPPDGPYACMGEIGTVVQDIAGKPLVMLRPGVYMDEADDLGWHWRATTRARFPGQRATVVGDFERRRRFPGAPGHPVPLTCPCSHGGHLNLVTPEMLTVLE